MASARANHSRDRSSRARTPEPSIPERSLASNLQPSQTFDSEWWHIDQILEERGSKYKVSWLGTDPETGRRWKPEWVRKDAVTADAKEEWAAKKRARRAAKKSRGGSGPARKAHSAGLQLYSVPSAVYTESDDSHLSTQASEYQPTQAFPVARAASPSSFSQPPDSDLLSQDTFNSTDAQQPSRSGEQPRCRRLLLVGVVIEPPGNINPGTYACYAGIERGQEDQEVPNVPNTKYSHSKEQRIGSQNLQKPVSPKKHTADERIIPDSQSFGDSTIYHSSLNQDQQTPPGSPLLQEVRRPLTSSEESLLYQDATEYIEPVAQELQEVPQDYIQNRRQLCTQCSQGNILDSYLPSGSPPPSYESSIAQSNSVAITYEGGSIERFSSSQQLNHSQGESQSIEKSDVALPDETQEAAQQVSYPGVDKILLAFGHREILAHPEQSLETVEAIRENVSVSHKTTQPGSPPEASEPVEKVAFSSQPELSQSFQQFTDSLSNYIREYQFPTQFATHHTHATFTSSALLPRYVYSPSNRSERSVTPEKNSDPTGDFPDACSSLQKGEPFEDDLFSSSPARVVPTCDRSGKDEYVFLGRDPPVHHVREHSSAERSAAPVTKLPDWFERSPKTRRFVSEPARETVIYGIPDTSEIIPGASRTPLLFSGAMSGGTGGGGAPGGLSFMERLAARRKVLVDKIDQAKTTTISPRATPQAEHKPATRSPSVIPSQLSSSPAPVYISEPPPKARWISQPSQFPSYQPMLAQSAATTQSTVDMLSQPRPMELVTQSQVSGISNITREFFIAPELGPEEYVVGLPLSTSVPISISQKRAHEELIISNHAKIDTYLDAPSPELEEEMNEILDKLAKISTHPGLACDVPFPETSDTRKVEFNICMSSKFKFLKEILDTTREEYVKIALVSQPGMLIDMLEKFLRDIRVQHTRLDRLSTLPPVPDEDIEGMVKVLLLSSERGSGSVVGSCDVVIAVDSTFSIDSFEIQEVRSSIDDPEKLAPVIRLIALNTIEHIKMCTPKEQSTDTTRACIEVVKILRHDAGVLDSGYAAKMGDGARKVGEWVCTRCEGMLDVPSLPELPLYEAAASQMLRLEETKPVHIDLSENEPLIEKRKREENGSQVMSMSPDGHDTKKPKLLTKRHPLPPRPPPPIDGNLADITHVSDSVPSTKQAIGSSAQPHTVEELETAQDEVGPGPMDIDDGETTEEEEFDVVFVQPPTIPGERKLESLTSEELRGLYREQEVALQTWMDSSGRLQQRYEHMKISHRDIKNELKAKEKELATVVERRERVMKQLVTMGAQNTQLGAELDHMRKEILSGPPEAATLVRLSDEKAEFAKKLEIAESRIAATETEAQFAREQYQKASNATYEMRKEISELTRSNEDLQRRADERVVELRKLQNTAALEARDQEIKELKIRLKEQGDRIAKLEQDKANPQRVRGGWGTRSTSVPRRGSPAQSRATSPQAALVMSPVGSGGYHPLRHHAPG